MKEWGRAFGLPGVVLVPIEEIVMEGNPRNILRPDMVKASQGNRHIAEAPAEARNILRPDMVKARAESLEEAGLETPVSLRPLEQEELGRYAGKKYGLVDGQLRVKAAQSKGWERVAAYVEAISKKQAVEKAMLGNVSQEMEWIDIFTWAEKVKETNPSITQEGIGKIIARTQQYVSQGLAVMDALNPTCRELIYKSFVNQGSFEITFLAAQQIAKLYDRDNKDYSKVIEALEWALGLGRKLSEAEAGALVEWMKAGKPAKEFEAGKRSPRAKAQSPRFEEEAGPSSASLAADPAPALLRPSLNAPNHSDTGYVGQEREGRSGRADEQKALHQATKVAVQTDNGVVHGQKVTSLDDLIAQRPKGLKPGDVWGKLKTCDDYQALIKSIEAVCSMSRKGNCWENAVMESFFHTLKTELIYHEDYHTPWEAKRSVFEWIEVFYNRKRLHSTLDYQSPEAYEKAARLN